MSTTKCTKSNLALLKESLNNKNNGSVGVRMNAKIYEVVKGYCGKREMAGFIGLAVIEKMERELK